MCINMVKFGLKMGEMVEIKNIYPFQYRDCCYGKVHLGSEGHNHWHNLWVWD